MSTSRSTRQAGTLIIFIITVIGYPNRKTHALNHQSNEQIYLFFQHFLKPKHPINPLRQRGKTI